MCAMYLAFTIYPHAKVYFAFNKQHNKYIRTCQEEIEKAQKSD